MKRNDRLPAGPLRQSARRGALAVLSALALAGGAGAAEADRSGDEAKATMSTNVPAGELKPTSTTAQIEQYVREAQLHPYWKERTDFFREDNPKHKPGGVVMIGDSITQGYPVDEFFPDGSVVSRGINGDVIVGLIRRLDESVFQLSPSKVFILIGINDVGSHREYLLSDYTNLYYYLFSRIREKAPQAKVYVQSVLPAGGGVADQKQRVADVNEIQKRLAAQFGFTWVDLHPVFAGADGGMNIELAADGVHPNRQGQERWKAVLEKYLTD